MAELAFAGPLAAMGCIIAVLVYSFNRTKLAATTAARDGANREEIEQLKRRVATLEQLLTDEDRKLAGDIDRLRRTDEVRPGV